MARQKHKEPSIERVFEYMENLTQAMSVIKQEIEMLRDRVETLETKLLNAQATSIGIKRGPPVQQEPPRIKFSPPSELKGPVTIKDELESVLTEGIKLQTVEEGKRQQFREKQEAVHEEFKTLRSSKTKKDVFKAPPKKKSRWRRGKKKELEFPDDLAADLSEAFESISKKKK